MTARNCEFVFTMYLYVQRRAMRKCLRSLAPLQYANASQCMPEFAKGFLGLLCCTMFERYALGFHGLEFYLPTGSSCLFAWVSLHMGAGPGVWEECTTMHPLHPTSPDNYPAALRLLPSSNLLPSIAVSLALPAHDASWLLGVVSILALSGNALACGLRVWAYSG